MPKRPEVAYYYRGMVERGPRYAWREGYSSQDENGAVLYPWMTRRECQQDAKRRGEKAVFYRDGRRESPGSKSIKQIERTMPQAKQVPILLSQYTCPSRNVVVHTVLYRGVPLMAATTDRDAAITVAVRQIRNAGKRPGESWNWTVDTWNGDTRESGTLDLSAEAERVEL